MLSRRKQLQIDRGCNGTVYEVADPEKGAPAADSENFTNATISGSATSLIAPSRPLEENKGKKIMVVLGCGMEELQNDRVTTAVEYANTIDSEIVWFLTGGVKSAITRGTEASKMEKQIKNKMNNIVLDEKAKNTAENFAYLKKWMGETYTNSELPEIVITTSAFHKERAEKIFKGIFIDNNGIRATWNLSDSACITCWNDEKIHMKNVENDVKNARKILE